MTMTVENMELVTPDPAAFDKPADAREADLAQ